MLFMILFVGAFVAQVLITGWVMNRIIRIEMALQSIVPEDENSNQEDI